MQLSPLKSTILIPIAIFIGFLALTIVVITAYQHDGFNTDVLEAERQKATATFEHFVRQETAAMQGMVAALSRNEQLMAAFKARDRDRLNALAMPLYRDLNRSNNITHFYVFDTARKTFSRAHQPTRHGDVINRATMRMASETQRPATGIEMGPLGTFTLRMVVPWWDGKHLIGFLELGKEIDTLVESLRDTFATDIYVLIDKKYLHSSDWQTGNRMLGQAYDWNTFDNHVLISPPVDNAVLAQLATMTDEEPLQIRAVGERRLAFLSLPISDANGAPVAFMVQVFDMTERQAAFARFITIVVVASVLGAAALISMFWFILERVELKLGRAETQALETAKQLREHRDKLELLIDERTRQLQEEIEERKNFERELSRAKEYAEDTTNAKTNFLANMSHELRTPLNAILGFADTIRSGVFGPLTNKKYAGYVEDIYESGAHLLALINDILDISAVEAERLELYTEKVQADTVIADSIRIVAGRADKKGISLETDISDDLPPLWGDERRIKQVLLNLLTNAIKFTPPGGRVELLAHTNDDMIDIEVVDTGPGMEKDQIATALTKFGRIDALHTRNEEGTGLGLPLTKALVERQGGCLEIESELGKGTTVRVALPMATDCPIV